MFVIKLILLKLVGGNNDLVLVEHGHDYLIWIRDSSTSRFK